MKKIFGFAAVIAMVAVANVRMSSNNSELTTLQLDNIEYLAEAEHINPACPNGCHENGNGCYCYINYNNLREHQW